MVVQGRSRKGWRATAVAFVATLSLSLSLGTAALADTITTTTTTTTTSSSEVALNGVNVSYNADAGYLSIIGTPYLYSSSRVGTGASSGGFTPSGTFSIEAWLNPADGSLNHGTVTMGGTDKAADSMVAGNLTKFSFLKDGPIFFQFAFAVSGGSLASTFGGGGGATIDAGSETFDGSYLHAFSGEGTGSVSRLAPSVSADAAAVPLPAGLPAGLALFAGVGIFYAVRSRRMRYAHN
jgi:hypothetical protein